MKYSGSEWIKKEFSVGMSPLGTAVADLLGDVWAGIYHLDSGALKRVDWHHPFFIDITLRGSLSTFDSDHLTALVVLSHDRMLRMTVEPAAPRYLRLTFHQRHTRTGSMMERIPTIEDHIAAIRSRYE
jgi:hypothetical protein